MGFERRLALWLLIAAAHVGLVAGLAPHRSAPPEPTWPGLAVKLLPLPRAVKPKPEARPGAQRPAAPARRLVPTPARPEPPALEAPPSTQPAPPTDIAEAVPAPPSAALLVNSEATRQAIRQAARAPLLAERAASASQAPARENAQERFGREVARTAYGNCLKGEFPGSGGGLLSLPFWIAAEVSGKCKK
ncbi:hypothetical protein [Roseateles sp.]|uniref:hypothetical protein n=1 Tax=Roseateles sp. TaxID=1971397 RepID=UPI0025F327E7|nr:hypothetical protein [Roseateles sp.]MBV8034717.1 hypothetical protein [Roseateles sp.]